AGENEYTWWRTLSLLGNITDEPTMMGFTLGTNSASIWSMISLPRAACTAAAGTFAPTATTTASSTGRPAASFTSTRRSAARAAVLAAPRVSANSANNPAAASRAVAYAVVRRSIAVNKGGIAQGASITQRPFRGRDFPRQVDVERAVRRQRIARAQPRGGRAPGQLVGEIAAAEGRVRGDVRGGQEHRNAGAAARQHVATAEIQVQQRQPALVEGVLRAREQA